MPGIEIDGRVASADYPALAGAPFISRFQDKYGLPVVFENDVNAAAVGFAQRNPSMTLDTIAYLYFPQKYPPGAGLLIDGKLFRGKAQYAGEVSHLPLGIDWGDPTLYASLEDSTMAVARVIASLSSVLNPHRVVLQSEFLSERHYRGIRARCEQLLPEAARPEISASSDFTGDLQTGIISLTLDRLTTRKTAVSLR